MSKYSAVILGAGGRGRTHIRAFLANSDRFELVAACDRDKPRMGDALNEAGLSLPIYTDADEMLTEVKPDVFCFVTQPDVRIEMIRLGAVHGVKAMAFEKPMAITLDEATQIERICVENEIKTVVCHQHKYAGHWQKVKEIVDSGQIGKVRSIHATARGWYWYYITHIVNYAMWLADFPKAKWIVGHTHGRDMLLDSHPSPDYVMGQVGFDSGVRMIFECGPLAPCLGCPDNIWLDAGAVVYGTEGFAEVIVGKGWRAMTKDSGGKIIADPNFSLEQHNETDHYISALGDWLDDDKKVHPCNVTNALHGYEICMGMLISSLDHRTVVPPVDRSIPVLDRLRHELPVEPFTPEEPKCLD